MVVVFFHDLLAISFSIKCIFQPLANFYSNSFVYF